MSVKARFTCNAIVKHEDGSKTAYFNAAYGPGNESFAAATPSAHLEMHISAGYPAGEYFEQGKNYNVELATDR